MARQEFHFRLFFGILEEIDLFFGICISIIHLHFGE